MTVSRRGRERCNSFRAGTILGRCERPKDGNLRLSRRSREPRRDPGVLALPTAPEPRARSQRPRNVEFVEDIVRRPERLVFRDEPRSGSDATPPTRRRRSPASARRRTARARLSSRAVVDGDVQVVCRTDRRPSERRAVSQRCARARWPRRRSVSERQRRHTCAHRAYRRAPHAHPAARR